MKTPLERQRLTFILITIGIVFLWQLTNSYFCTGWKTAAILSFLILALDYGFVIYRRDALLGKLVLFGLTAGAVELVADWWLVRTTGTLFYPAGDPRLLESPVYMPVAWGVVLVQIGYIGYRLSMRWPLWLAMLATGLLGGTLIPFYEHFAKGACWWWYEGAHHMLGNTPYYIMLGEFLITIPLPAIFRLAPRLEFYWMPLWGAAVGIWIWLSYLLAWWLIG